MAVRKQPNSHQLRAVAPKGIRKSAEPTQSTGNKHIPARRMNTFKRDRRLARLTVGSTARDVKGLSTPPYSSPSIERYCVNNFRARSYPLDCASANAVE